MAGADRSAADASATPNKWAALAAVCMALFVIALNTTAINTAIGPIADDLEISTSTLSWAVNAYVLAAAALVVIGGQIGDVLGKRAVLLLGIGVFAAGSLLVATATSGPQLILGRGTQGVGSAFMLPATMSVISVVFPPEERGTALGIWGAVAGIGFAIGPLYGGFFSDVISWRGIFFADLLWLGTAALMTLTFLRSLPRSEKRTRPDKTGAVLLALGLLLLVLAVQQGRGWGWTSPAFLGVLVGAVGLLVAFYVVEQCKQEPLIHFALFRNRRFVGGAITTFVNAVGLFGLLYFFNLYTQAAVLLDLSALRAGVVLLPYGLTMFVFAFLGGRVSDRIGFVVPITVAFAAMTASYLLLSRVSQATTDIDLLLPLFLGGFGVGVTMSTTSAAGMAAVSDERAGEASGVINMFRYLGAVSIIAVGTILYVGQGIDALNEHLDAASIGPVDESRLDRALTGSTENLQDVERELDPSDRRAFEQGVAIGIIDGFRAVMLLSAALTVMGAAAALVLLRRRAPKAARIHAEEHEVVAGFADPDQPRPR